MCLHLEPIAGTPPSQSLEDITLEDDFDLEQQLNEFLETETPERIPSEGTENEKLK